MEALKDFAIDSADVLGGFLMSAGSSKLLARNLGYKNRQYYSTLQTLRSGGYVKKVNEDQFLITPKAIKKIRMIKVELSVWEAKEWDGYWRIIIFDIPEKLRSKRAAFRSLIKRKGFVGVQQSVFIAPYANFEELALIRSDLGVEKYISFFLAKSSETDDDRLLKKRFDLK